MSEQFDIDAWENEAKEVPFTFRADGRDFSLPSAGFLDKSVLASVNLDRPSADDILTLLRIGLGDQWPDFDAAPIRLSSLGELFRRWQNHQGVSVGESVASADS
ncbi:hypothetical protein [Streptomyces harbinensis]